MRIQELLISLVIIGLIAAFFTAIEFMILLILELSVRTPFDWILDKIEDESKQGRCLIVLLVMMYIITFMVVNYNVYSEYSDCDYADEFEIVNGLIYENGSLIINGCYTEVDEIISSSAVPYDLVINGRRYKNKGISGLGTEKIPYKTLILRQSTSNKIKDVLEIHEDNGAYRLATKKVLDILHNNRLQSTIELGSNDITIRIISKDGIKDIEVDNDVAELKKEIENYKREIKELKENTINIENKDELALKWLMKIIIVIWLLSLISFVVIKRINNK